ncbi:MAG: nucleotidyltransferase family protein [Spirochaetia bacterium]|nr:nucleotidyltransferase family protein [Spirochaetia bacterium]
MEQYCIIPAAGRSSRMGGWKPLLPWGSTTVCATVVDTVLSAGLKPLVVAGYRASELMAAFSDRPEIGIVVNDDWALGMLGSIRVGARRALALSLQDSGKEADGFFVAPADMPRLPPEAFIGIVSALDGRAGSTQGAIFAARGSRLGHPVWIPTAFLPEMTRLHPDSRLRDFLLGRPWTSVEIASDGIFIDIDTPEAYEAELLSE